MAAPETRGRLGPFELTSEVLRAFVRSLFAVLRRRARRTLCVQAQQCRGVTFIQRFGSALNLNVHFHTLALDGVYPYAPSHDHPPSFLPLRPPGPDDVARVLAGAARRIQRVIEARDADDADALERDEPLLALLAAASLRTRIAASGGDGSAIESSRATAAKPRQILRLLIAFPSMAA